MYDIFKDTTTTTSKLEQNLVKLGLIYATLKKTIFDPLQTRFFVYKNNDIVTLKHNLATKMIAPLRENPGY